MNNITQTQRYLPHTLDTRFFSSNSTVETTPLPSSAVATKYPRRPLCAEISDLTELRNHSKIAHIVPKLRIQTFTPKKKSAGFKVYAKCILLMSSARKIISNSGGEEPSVS